MTMINEANSLDLDDLDDVQDYVNDSQESYESDPGTGNDSEHVEDNQEDFDLTKELLSLQGISDINKIKFEDESGAVVEKSWDTLSNNEKLMILSHQEDPETSLDQAEIELINQIRVSGMSPGQYMQKMVEQIQKKQTPEPQYEVDSMSDDELFCLDLLDKLGDDVTDEELQQALDSAKANKSIYDKQVASLRVYYKDLEEQRTQQIEAEKAQEAERRFGQFANSVVNSIRNFNTLEDTPVELSHTEMEDLANYILTRDASGYSTFGKMLNDPQQITKVAFWALKGPEILHEMQNQIKEAYLRGYNESNKQPQNKKVFTKSETPSVNRSNNKESQYASFDEDSYLNK